jgi:hypothetical protein
MIFIKKNVSDNDFDGLLLIILNLRLLSIDSTIQT